MKIRLECKGTPEEIAWILSHLAKHTNELVTRPIENERGEIVGTLWKKEE